MEQPHLPETVIAERYQIIKLLGEGGVGITYEAQDLENQTAVALKVLSFVGLENWKILELFEREAQILSQLNHPAIPRYFDYFQVSFEEDSYFYIVQQLAPGKSLETLVEEGWKPDEKQVKNIAEQLLEILIYLHSLVPPVIHRDIKPQNLILDEEGKLFLVDFGSVQDTYHHTVTGGSTIVGTYGYMAPEQFRGKAVPATDLYGLGTTLLFLLTKEPPSELPQRKLRIQFHPYINSSKTFSQWLERLVEPVIEDRFSTAQQALAVLQGKAALPPANPKPSKPKNSPVQLVKTNQALTIDIKPIGFRTPQSQKIGMISLFWNGIWILGVLLILQLTLYISPSKLFFLRLYVLIGLISLVPYLYGILSKTKFEINEKTFKLQKWVLGSRYKKIEGETKDIWRIKVYKTPLPMQSNGFCGFKIKGRTVGFGLLLTQEEKEWLVDEMNAFMQGRKQS